jgi:predicted acyltransferase
MYSASKLCFHHPGSVRMSKPIETLGQGSDQQNHMPVKAGADETTPLEKRLTKRLVSLDAYRGMIMICLISVGFGLSAFEGHPYLGFLSTQVDHVQWQGMVFWDLIQPAFMFMVGMAMPFAYTKRRSLGLSHQKIFLHVIQRAVFLIVIANVIGTIHRGEPGIGFINVLNQIAIGYFLAFLVINRSYLAQGLTAAGILLLYSIAWMLYPGNGPGGPWEMSVENLGGDFDMWLLGRNYGGFYVGLNAIPSTVTILFGMMIGRVVGSTESPKRILQILALAGVSGIVTGLALSPVIPIIKRIWTASFTLYSAGFVILGLLLVYWAVEMKKWTRWTYVAVVVGMNSIFAYIIFQLARGSVEDAVMAFIRPLVEGMGPWGSVLHSLLSLAVIWYVLRFFYKRKIFFKV